MKIFPIWFSYLFWYALRRFALYLLLIFSLFILFDYSLVWIKSPPQSFFLNYLGLFSYRFEYFVPLAFLLACSVTLFTYRSQLELLALEIAGLAKQKLFLPLITLGILITFLGYANNEWILPKLFPHIEKKQKKYINALPFKVHALDDGSVITYQTKENTHSDFYWIQPGDELWHAKEISFEGPTIQAFFVDHLKRDPTHHWQHVESFPSYEFTSIFSNTLSPLPKAPILSISGYCKVLQNPIQRAHLDTKMLSSLFYYKLLNPFTSLILLQIFLFVFYRFSLQQKVSFYLFTSLLIFLSFFSFMKACIIFSKNYMMTPWAAFILMPAILAGFFHWKLRKVLL